MQPWASRCLDEAVAPACAAPCLGPEERLIDFEELSGERAVTDIGLDIECLIFIEPMTLGLVDAIHQLVFGRRK